MAERAVWMQVNPCNFVLERNGCRFELRYEAAGFQSRWVVLLDGRVLDYCSDYMNARAYVQALAAGLERKVA